uniref:Uncharacterized protein n=1 Tax=Setaria italica TaxID=4555 RepID=K3Y4C2_SETIT
MNLWQCEKSILKGTSVPLIVLVLNSRSNSFHQVPNFRYEDR